MGWIYYLAWNGCEFFMNRDELKTTFALGSIFAFRMLGLFMILPIFSLFAEKLPLATPTLIGLALGIYGLTQALFQLPFGIWSDFIARKKVIFIGLLIFVAGSIVAALSGNNIYGIIIGRALQGAGAIGSTTTALIGDLTSEQNRTKAMAIVGITIGLSFVIAIVLGPVLGHLIGVTGIFWLTAIFALLGLFILRYWVPTSPQKKRDFEPAQLKKQLAFVISHPQLLGYDLSIFMAHAILTATFFALPIILTSQYQLPIKQQWQLYLPAFALTLIFIGRTMRQKNFSAKEKHWLILNIICILIAQAILCLNIKNRLLLYVALYLFFQGFTFLEALLPSMVSKTISIDFRGSAMGVFSSCQFLGIFAGGLWGGLLAQHFQLNGVFLGNAALTLLWAIVMVPLCLNKKSS
jgi:predicted MFS family arabinose efflux permease